MTDTSSTPVAELVDRTVVDVNGDKIGKIFDVYLDNDTNQPEWLAVNTGLFGSKVSFVPIEGATFAGDDDVMVGYTKDQVKDAPNADADGQLTPDEEAALYAHYGRATTTTATRSTGDADTTVGHDTSGPETDTAMTRSEEELDVSKTTRQAGTARLKKWIETENVTITVPIRREKARLVVEPVSDANIDQALSGGDLTTEEHEVILSEEVIDVNKRVVPKERVRLETDVETKEVVVDEEVRKEHIAMDDETTTSTRRPVDPT